MVRFTCRLRHRDGRDRVQQHRNAVLAQLLGRHGRRARLQASNIEAGNVTREIFGGTRQAKSAVDAPRPRRAPPLRHCSSRSAPLGRHRRTQRRVRATAARRRVHLHVHERRVRTRRHVGRLLGIHVLLERDQRRGDDGARRTRDDGLPRHGATGAHEMQVNGTVCECFSFPIPSLSVVCFLLPVSRFPLSCLLSNCCFCVLNFFCFFFVFFSSSSFLRRDFTHLSCVKL